MAVEIKYVVIREGEEKMSFANKKDADAYDKMLDLAEVLGDWLEQSPVAIDDEQRDGLSMWLAEQRDVLGGILKSGKLPDNDVQKEKPSATKKTAEADESQPAQPDAKVADVKAIKAA